MLLQGGNSTQLGLRAPCQKDVRIRLPSTRPPRLEVITYAGKRGRPPGKSSSPAESGGSETPAKRAPAKKKSPAPVKPVKAEAEEKEKDALYSSALAGAGSNLICWAAGVQALALKLDSWNVSIIALIYEATAFAIMGERFFSLTRQGKKRCSN